MDNIYLNNVENYEKIDAEKSASGIQNFKASMNIFAYLFNEIISDCITSFSAALYESLKPSCITLFH